MLVNIGTLLDGKTILASNDYQALPITVTETAEVKAGMPLTNEGKKAADGTNAVGILLYDVDPTRNPNGAVVVDGVIDWDKCKANNDDLSALTVDKIAKALPNIIFRDAAGKNYAGTAAAGDV